MISLPAKLIQNPTEAHSSRNGARVRLVVLHRWGVPYLDMEEESRSYQGVQNYFKDVEHKVSAHIVFPGSAKKNEATQMVPKSEKAWAESFFNSVSMDIESADAIWEGEDPKGMQVLARIVAFELWQFKLPAVYVNGSLAVKGMRGFCRHADLGSAGGGHFACPTTSMKVWKQFVALVQAESKRGGFRKVWDK